VTMVSGSRLILWVPASAVILKRCKKDGTSSQVTILDGFDDGMWRFQHFAIHTTSCSAGVQWSNGPIAWGVTF
jgi:hypothetical protein